MAQESENGSRTGKSDYQFEARSQIYGLISSARVDGWIQWFWMATGDIVLLRELLEWEVQERPEIRRVLERVIEYEGKLVTASRIIEKVPEV